MSDVIDHAFVLRQRGYYPYPVNVRLDPARGEKVPQFKTEQGGKVGWQEGSYPTEYADVRDHWRGYEGIAIDCGRSGLVVVDVDMKKGVDGFAELKRAGVVLPVTPGRALTPTGGGKHGFYRMNPIIPVRNSAKLLAPGVDIRGVGGVVFVSPTAVSGLGEYSWIDLPHGPPRVDALPFFPDDVAESLRKVDTGHKTGTERPALTIEQRTTMIRRMEWVLRDLRNMEPGQRHETMKLKLRRLFGLGLSLGEDLGDIDRLARDAYFESGGDDQLDLEKMLEWAKVDLRFELPEDDDATFEAEVARLVRQAKARDAAQRLVSPIRVKQITEADVIEFDPAKAESDSWVNPLVPRGETVILFGEPNAGKTFAAMDLALGIATDTSVWGMPVARQGRVLYLAGEGSRRLALRREAWEQHHQRKAGDAVQLRHMRLILSSDQSVAEHQRLVADFGADVIIVDTLMRAAEGLVLEVPSEAARAVAQLDRLREDRPGATVVVLHHPPESGNQKPGGSYPLRGNVDTILKISNMSGDIYMSVLKSKESDTRWVKPFALRDVAVTDTLTSAVFLPRH